MSDPIKEVLPNQITLPQNLSQEKLEELSPNYFAELIFRLIQLQALNCRKIQQNLEATRYTLNDLYSGKNKQRCETHATTDASKYTYMSAVLHVAAAGTPFTSFAPAAQGVSGIASSTGSIGGIKNEQKAGERASLEHEEGCIRRTLDAADRSASNAYSQIDVLNRLCTEFFNKMNQTATSIVS